MRLYHYETTGIHYMTNSFYCIFEIVETTRHTQLENRRRQGLCFAMQYIITRKGIEEQWFLYFLTELKSITLESIHSSKYSKGMTTTHIGIYNHISIMKKRTRILLHNLETFSWWSRWKLGKIPFPSFSRGQSVMQIDHSLIPSPKKTLRQLFGHSSDCIYWISIYCPTLQHFYNRIYAPVFLLLGYLHKGLFA